MKILGHIYDALAKADHRNMSEWWFFLLIAKADEKQKVSGGGITIL